jgi:hypothetical protein
MAVEHSLDPLFYNYPPLTFDLFAAAAALAGLLGHPIGPATHVDPSAAYMAARTVSAIAFVACVGFVYFTRAAVDGALGGLVAGLCLALAPLAVRQAHFATPDMAATALVAAAMWQGGRAATRSGFVMAGLLCGLAAAAKQTAGVVVVFPLVLILLGGQDRRGRVLSLVAGSTAGFAGVVALAGHPGDYLRGLAFLGTRAGQRYGDLPLGLIYHPVVSLPFGLGFGTFALTLAGLGLAAVRRRPLDLALVAFLLVYLVVIGLTHEDFWRYVMPMLPALSLLAGGLVALLPTAAPARAVFLAGFLILLAPSAYASFTTDRLLGETDTRRQAADWLLHNAPAQSALSIGNYWAQPLYDGTELAGRPLHPLYLTGDPIVDSFQQGLFTDRFRVNQPGEPCYTLAESGPPWQTPPPATSGTALAVFRPYSGTVAAAGARYDPLDAFYLPIWGFAGLERPGPSIAIVAGCSGP